VYLIKDVPLSSSKSQYLVEEIGKSFDIENNYQSSVTYVEYPWLWLGYSYPVKNSGQLKTILVDLREGNFKEFYFGQTVFYDSFMVS
jgi:hypothetical protein